MIFDRFVCAGVLGCALVFVLTGCGGENPDDPDNPGCIPSPAPEQSTFAIDKPKDPIGGYLKADKEIMDEIDMAKFADVDIVYYSYLTLDPSPDNKRPHNKSWGGNMFIEPKTLAPIDQVMGSIECESSYYDQQKRIRQVMDTCVTTNKMFIWSIGGWGDLTWTLKDKQIDAFVDKVAVLLTYGGDGVDLAFQHLSNKDNKDGSTRQLLGKLIPKLRKKLDDSNMKHAKIVYTGNFNCFKDPTKTFVGWNNQDSDGECLDTFNATADPYTGTIAEAKLVDWVNLQFYDAVQLEAITNAYFHKEDFEKVVDAAMHVLDGERIMVGMKPGLQTRGAHWEGFDIDLDVVGELKGMGAGGIFIYNMNDETPQDDPRFPYSTKHKWQGSLGKNAQYLAVEARKIAPADASTLLV